MNNLPKILILTGPTCSGKTFLAHLIADKIPSEIVSADSRQVFKGLNIGTSKPAKIELKKYNYHCVDILKPTQNYSAGDFQIDGRNAIKKILKLNKLPIIVGGTGLFIRALVDGLIEGVERNDLIRDELEIELKEKGLNSLFNKLKKVDPKTADKIDSKNPRRVIRALEVFKLTGKSIKSSFENQNKIKLYNPHFISLNWERSNLYDKINNRVDKMIENGFVDEVKKLFSSGLDENYQSMQTVGYKELLLFLKNKLSFDEAINLIKQNTRRYAKRQITWFKKEKRINWLEVAKENEFEKLSAKILDKFDKKS
ncbi:MAG: tRNA (adenosine(37)-N6)-dimethylallyltransferase MiaA [Bacteroidetes bacterium]|nr:tRNA (adenosine(37)-N6)-dimethylallyltransferase MiaA [Bacteroidota bacterium]